MTAQNGEGVYGDGVGVVTPLAHKLSQNGQVVKDSTGRPRSGVFYAGTASLVTGKANMSYDVAPFEAAICRGRTKGTSYPTNDAVVNVTTTAAPGSNKRIDIIYGQQQEVSEGDAATQFVIGVVQGTAASSPSAPTLPDGAIELARAEVSAGITATTSAVITQTARFTAAAGGVVAVRNTTERDAESWLESQQVWDLATDTVWVYDGTSFKYSSGVKPVARVTKTTAQATSGTAGVYDPVLFDVEAFDPFGIHSTSSNTSRLVVPAGWGGYWDVSFHLEGSSLSPTVVLGGSLWVNGVEVRTSRDNVPPTANSFSYPKGRELLLLAAGDYVEVRCVSNATSVSLTPAGCDLMAAFVGSA